MFAAMRVAFPTGHDCNSLKGATNTDNALSPAAGAADWFVGGPRGDTPKHVQAASDLELASTDLDAASSYQVSCKRHYHC